MDVCALHLGAPEPHPYATEADYAAALEQAAELVSTADAVVVGVGSGMSSSCGYDFYHRTDAFDDRFARFERAHGFSNLMEGHYHVYSNNEQRWAFLAEYVTYLEELPVGEAYASLVRLLGEKPHFVLTSNVDGQVRRAFPEERTWLFQGDFGYLQCVQPCCDELVPAVPLMRGIRDALGPDGLEAPSELLPRCQECGWLMEPWVRDDTFLEGGLWQAQGRCYADFVTDALEGADHVLFLELGVGGMTPGVIELPFWRLVEAHENAFYLRVNKGKAGEPLQLGGRSLTVTADLGDALGRLADLLRQPAPHRA